MTQQLIDVGSSPNDGTGDPLREAFTKVNSNFSEIYSSFVASGQITVGNTTVNTSISNTNGLYTGNTTVNTTANSLSISVNGGSSYSSVNASSLVVSNSTVVNSSTMFIGNSTVNAVHTTSNLSISNSTTQFLANRNYLLVGNSTVNTVVNSSSIDTSEVIVSSNTINLGNPTKSSNGYTYLPNGIKMNWGVVSSNSTVGTVTFTSSYSEVYVVTATTTNTEFTYQPAVVSQNTTTAEIRTSNSTTKDIYWTAIGV